MVASSALLTESVPGRRCGLGPRSGRSRHQLRQRYRSARLGPGLHHGRLPHSVGDRDRGLRTPPGRRLGAGSTVGWRPDARRRLRRPGRSISSWSWPWPGRWGPTPSRSGADSLVRRANSSRSRSSGSSRRWSRSPEGERHPFDVDQPFHDQPGLLQFGPELVGGVGVAVEAALEQRMETAAHQHLVEDVEDLGVGPVQSLDQDAVEQHGVAGDGGGVDPSLPAGLPGSPRPGPGDAGPALGRW